jgi:hypothetical protein
MAYASGLFQGGVFMTFRLFVAAAALACVGCVSTFSYIDGNKWHRAELNTYSVIVLDVDGVSYIRSPVMIDPGRRVIRVQGPPAPGFTYGETRTLTLDVKPCTRYYLKAVKENPLAQDFTPMVDYEEPISGCK